MSREFPKNNPPQNIALPTVGRIVLFRQTALSVALPAIVVAVSEGSLKIDDLCAFTTSGPEGYSSVRHASEEMGAHTPRWDWMDYQKGQAAKTEQLEKLVEAGAPSTVDGKR